MRCAVAIAVAAAACCEPSQQRDAGCDPSQPDAGSNWSFGPPLPEPRLEAGVAALGDKIAIVGGFDAELAITAEAFLFDPTVPFGMVTLLPDAPVAWTHIGLAGNAGSLYLLGGLEGPAFVPRGESWVLDSEMLVWMPLPPMPFPRGAAGIAVTPTRIVLAGGATDTEAVDSVVAFDIGDGVWFLLPPLPEPRSHPAAFALSDGSVIVTGGLATLSSTSARSETWRLDPGAPAWRPLAPMPTARGGCSYGSLGAVNLCAGGEANGAALRVVEAYEVANDSWHPLHPMLEPRAGTQGAALGVRFYVPGGARSLNFAPLDTVLVYDDL